jgi:hypothetical protein
VGETVQNVGYGATEVNPDNSLRFWTTEPITELRPAEFIVWGQGVSSVCYGDSGGPSFYLFSGHTLRVIGTVSWGDPSCVDYDHFARVDDNQAFIAPYLTGADPCFGIDATGLCDGDVALWCEGGQLRQECCGALGVACLENAQGQFRCGDNCGSLTYEGACEGNDAVWCAGGRLRRRRCEPCLQICGWAGDELGYYCIDP